MNEAIAAAFVILGLVSMAYCWYLIVDRTLPLVLDLLETWSDKNVIVLITIVSTLVIYIVARAAITTLQLIGG